MALDDLRDLLLGEPGAVLLADLHRELRELLFGHVRGDDDAAARGAVAAAPEVAAVRNEGQHHEPGEHEEGHDALPQLDPVRREDPEDHAQPQVGEDGHRGADAEDVHGLYLPDLGRRDGGDADRADHQEVEGRAADDGRGPEGARVEVVGEELRGRDEDLRRGAPQGHEREVGDCRVPDPLVELPLRAAVDLDPHDDLGARDLLYAGHELVADDAHAHEGPDEGGEVDARAQVPRPGLLVLPEEGRYVRAFAAGVAGPQRPLDALRLLEVSLGCS
mmetsp:Transcript_6447/g.19897  ORF Transcript_6447/g.19897 Transcript_6447/m.19897 type:complete len:276 (-) Transcript_6447:379-1206(-)